MDLQTIIDIDRQLLGIINGNHNMFLDKLMLTLTSGVTWIPLYVALLYMVVRNKETMGQIAKEIAGCRIAAS